MTTAERRKEILTQFIRRVWSEGEIEASGEYLAPRYTIHHDPGDPWHGQQLSLEGFQERARKSRAPFPDQRFELLDLFAEGDKIAVTWFWTATHGGDLPGFPVSGKQIRISGATVYYFEDDRIAGHWQVVDRLGVFRQLQSPQ